MKRSILATVLVVSAAALLVQCKEDVSIDFSNFEPKLVVNAQLNPGQSFSFNVAESVSPVSSQAGRIPDGLSLMLRD
ncbi:MAG: hypothetical protein R3330_19060, partial [Saprospiraceae bacterium]|nr:hypothetical protein [Saprospiraceae bacterium]